MDSEVHLTYWIYNKMLWMLAGCIVLMAVWIFTCFSILVENPLRRLTTFLFFMAFISFACYIWEKREFYSRQLQQKGF